MAFRKIEAGLVHAPVDEFIGKTGTIFYDNDLGDFRISDGQTPGGIALSFGGGDGGSYTLPTATTTVKGGVKIDGSTIAIANQVISVGTVPYSKLSGTPTIPSNTNQLTNGAEYITSSALTGYATENYVTGRGYITSSALTGYATESYVTNRGYITSSALTGLATESYVTSQGYITSSALIGYATESYVTNRGYITSSALTGLATETFVTTQGYITSAALSGYALTGSIPTDISDLTDNLGLLGQGGGGTTYITNNVENPYAFSIAGDDSTLREIANGESIKFTGAGGITIATDDEGNVTITGNGSGGSDRLVAGDKSVILGTDGTLTTPDFWRVGNGNTNTSISNDGFANNRDLWLRAGDALFITTDLTVNGEASDSLWLFSNKVLQLPNGGDIVDSNGDTVLGGTGGSGDSLVNGDSSFSISTDGTLTLTHPDEPNFHPLETQLIIQKAAGNYHTISGAYGLSLQATPVPSGYGLNTNTNFVDIFHDGVSVNVNDNTWGFGTDGTLTFPDTTVQHTAWTGTTLSISDTAPTDKDFWYNTTDGRLYVKDDDVWVDANPQITQQVPTDISDLTDDLGLLQQGGGVSSWNDLTDKPTIPNLGKFVFGSDGDSAFIHTTNDAGGLDGYDIVLSPGGESYTSIRVPNTTNTLAGDPVRISNMYENGSVAIETNGGDFTFNSNGKLTFPNGSTIGDSDAVFGVPITTTRGSILIGNQAECIGGENHFHIMKAGQQAIDLFLGDDNNYVKLPSTGGVEISSSELGAQHYWTFGTDGVLTLPADTPIIKGGGTGTGVTVIAGTEPVDIFEGSLEFIGSGTILLSPGVAVGGVGDTGNGLFTIDAWVKFSEDPATHQQYILGSNFQNGFSLFVGDGQATPSATKITVDCQNVSDTQFEVPALTTNTWYHIAVARNSSGMVSVWVNGVRSTTGAIGLSNGPVAFTGLTTQIGSWSYNNTTQMLGNMGQVRIVTGNNVYNPNNSTITVPTADLQTVTGTQLLLLMKSVDQYGDDTENNTLSVYSMAGSTTLPAWTTDAPTTEIPVTWTFGTDGDITFPDNTVQYTAWQGSTVVSDTAPEEALGRLWYNTTDGRTYVRYNDTWVDASPQIPQETFSGDYNDLINIPEATLADRLVAGSKSVILGTDGLITFPDFDGTKTLWGAVDEDFSIRTTRTDPGSDADIDIYAADDLRLYAEGDELELHANSNVLIYTDTANTNYEWTFGDDGNLTIPGNIRKTTDASIVVGDSVLNFNVEVVDELIPPGDVWRIFFDDGQYPNLGNIVQIGDTVTTAWGTPITATITDVLQLDGEWRVYVAQDITVGFDDGPQTVTFSSVADKTWTFGTDGIITLPNGMSIDSYGTLGVNAFLEIGGDDTRITIDNDGAPPGLYITANATGGMASRTWHFGPDGDITFPDATVQTTAWTGTTLSVSSSAPTDKDFWFNTTDGRLYLKDNSIWVDASPQIPQQVPTDISDLTDLTGLLDNTGSGITFQYSRLQEGITNSSFVTSITGLNETGLSLTSNRWAQLMWVPDITTVTLNDIDDGGDTYNWAYTESGGFIVENKYQGTIKSWRFNRNGTTEFPNYTFPSADGAANQVLKTDGNGNLTWTDQGATPDRLTSNARSATLNSNGTFSLPTLTAAPADPQAGQMALADGVSWNPLSQTGTSPYMVIYTGTGWLGLGGGVTMDQVYGAILELGTTNF